MGEDWSRALRRTIDRGAAAYRLLFGPMLLLINVANPLQTAFRQIDECGETRQ
jgi:hypothetical protein